MSFCTRDVDERNNSEAADYADDSAPRYPLRHLAIYLTRPLCITALDGVERQKLASHALFLRRAKLPTQLNGRHIMLCMHFKPNGGIPKEHAQFSCDASQSGGIRCR